MSVQVFPSLVLSPIQSSYPKDWIVISLLNDEENPVPGEIRRPMEKDGMTQDKYVRNAVFTVLYYLQQGKNVLVHCHGGKGRSAIVGAIVYSIVTGMSPEKSILYIRKLYNTPVLSDITKTNQIKRLIPTLVN